MKPETVRKIETEQQRQVAKFGPEEFRSIRAERVLAVLMGEVGELAEALLKARDLAGWRHAEEELIHVAAVAVTWLDDCFGEGL